MAIRPNVYNASSAGMTRLRSKGGASAETLYELTNAFVNADRMPQRRPGAISYQYFPDFLGAGVKVYGLAAFNGKLHTFTTNATLGIPGDHGTYVVDLLLHPKKSSADIKVIHFAKPYMGFLYVVAEFTDGIIAHYWLQNPPDWQNAHGYNPGDLVQPSYGNPLRIGYYYKATRQKMPPAWTPNHTYTLLSEVQPTEYNGYSFYAQGVNPSSGAPSGGVEPNWNATPGGYTVESTAGNSKPPSTAPDQPDEPPSPDTRPGGKYGNPGGSGSGGRFTTQVRVN